MSTYSRQLEWHRYLKFGAVASLVQMKIENEETVIQVFWKMMSFPTLLLQSTPELQKRHQKGYLCLPYSQR